MRIQPDIDILIDILSKMPPRHVKVAFLRADGMSYSEIAAQMGFSESRAHQIFKQIKRVVKGKMAREIKKRSL